MRLFLRLSVFVILSSALGSSASLAQAVFTVNTTVDSLDSSPGDGVCADTAGLCSLRAAIMEANAVPSVEDDVIDLPAGVYTLTRGSLAVTDGVVIRGAGSSDTIIDGDHRGGVLQVGSILYIQMLVQGTVNNGVQVPIAVATNLADFTNCRASQGCLGKPGLVFDDNGIAVGGSSPISPISFDFTLTPAQVSAVTGSPGRGFLTVTASRDIGHKINVVPGDPGDVVPATLDGSPVGALFHDTIDTCANDFLDGVHDIVLDCGPNFHNDFSATDFLPINQGTFRAAAGNGTMSVVLSPVGGAGTLGVGRFKVFSVSLIYVKDLQVTLSGFTIRNGTQSGIRNDGGFVQGFDLALRDNSNFFTGGAIFNNIGSVILRDSTIANNEAGVNAGGIGNTILGTIELDRCTVSGNRAFQGAGISSSGHLRVLNSTVSHNIADAGGGGILNTGHADITFSTITGNIANDRREFSEGAVGGGIDNVPPGQINIGNTILAGNTDNRSGFVDESPDCFSELDLFFTSFRDNLIGALTPKCILKDATSGNTAFDLVGTPAAPINPRLGPLADNGGPTLTHALLAGSPAINRDTSGTSATFFDCPNIDQRGLLRPGDNPGDTRCDIGAYEFGARTVQPVDSTTGRQPLSVTFTNIITPGQTTLTTGPVGPQPPQGFMLGDPPIYYEVSTTTVFSGPVTICIDYSGVTFQNPSLLHLFHYEDTNSDGTPDTWVDRTTSVDTVNHIICATVDSFSLFAVLEKFDLPATLDGRMFGVGHIDQHQQQHHFVFRVAQIDSHDRGRFEYWVNATRACDPSHVVGDRQDDDDHDRDHDRDHCSAPNRFEATSITSVVFADDPAFRPGRGVRPVVDTVRFSGSGRWNGRPGYSFEVVATDHGEPGRSRDTLALIVKDSSDNVVATISGSLDGGNIQSTRLRP